MKTIFETKENALAQRKWFVVDADGQVVGRLASKIASILRGKNSPKFAPHNDVGGFVVVLNADKVRFTGRKSEQKKYYHHSGFIGGVREEIAGELLVTRPEEVIRRAVWGMLPKGPLGRQQLKKLKIYRGTDHPHAAQQPEQA